MKYKNTLNKGSVRYIIFKEADAWYGVALEFNLVVDGDNPLEVMASLFQAIHGYVETARKLKMRPLPLNQRPDKEYSELWERLSKGEIEKGVTKSEQVYTFGYTPFISPAFA